MEDQQKPQSPSPKPESRERRGSGRGRPGRRPSSEPREFDQKILDLARVTRVTAGGKRMTFRCALVVGDKKGRVGLGIAKGADVQIALDKAVRKAKKNVVHVPIVNGTIPHAVNVKFGSARLLLKPAPKGTGLKCGGAVRVVMELAGLPNAVSKIINSSNKINIAKATFAAIEILRRAPARSVAKPSPAAPSPVAPSVQ